MRHSNAFTHQSRLFITHCFCAVASCIVRRRTAENTRLPAEHSSAAAVRRAKTQRCLVKNAADNLHSTPSIHVLCPRTIAHAPDDGTGPTDHLL